MFGCINMQEPSDGASMLHHRCKLKVHFQIGNALLVFSYSFIGQEDWPRNPVSAFLRAELTALLGCGLI